MILAAPNDYCNGTLFCVLHPDGSIDVDIGYRSAEQINQASAALYKHMATATSAETLRATWADNASDLYVSLFGAIQDHVQSSSSALHYVLPSFLGFNTVPVAGCINSQGVPLIASFAVSQSPSVESLLHSAKKTEADPTATRVLLETPPAWLSRNLAKMLNAKTLGEDGDPMDQCTILHKPDSKSSHLKATLLVAEQYDAELFTQSGQTEYKSIFSRIGPNVVLNDREASEASSYIIYRHFYIGLTNGLTIAEAARKGLMECQKQHPKEPWRWGTFAVVNYSGALPILARHAAAVKAIVKERNRNSATRDAVRGSREFRYLNNHGIGPLFEHMLQHLLQHRPQNHDQVLNELIRGLEQNRSDWSLECQQALAAAEESTSAASTSNEGQSKEHQSSA